MYLQNNWNAAATAQQIMPTPAALAAHVAPGATLPADALGFPQTGHEARDAAAGQPVIGLLPADAVAFGGAGGFEDLPTALVANLIVAFLGSTALATSRHLATLYPQLREPIRHVVNADPVIQLTATLLPPMRVIALRDLLSVAPPRADGSKMTQAQYSQATVALREPMWLPIVERLVACKVDGVGPQHTALLAQFDSMLCGEKLEEAACKDTPRLAREIKLDAKRCQLVMDLVWLRQHGQVIPDLDRGITCLRKDVLRDAFSRITCAFAAEQGWTAEGLAGGSPLQ
ncbi:hypothetical protein BH11PSE7_BH11PSE7_15140 [soil metagenome]